MQCHHLISPFSTKKKLVIIPEANLCEIIGFPHIILRASSACLSNGSCTTSLYVYFFSLRANISVTSVSARNIVGKNASSPTCDVEASKVEKWGAKMSTNMILSCNMWRVEKLGTRRKNECNLIRLVLKRIFFLLFVEFPFL